jgi:hypothetical protein
VLLHFQHLHMLNQKERCTLRTAQALHPMEPPMEAALMTSDLA